jgi:hypothetical protein
MIVRFVLTILLAENGVGSLRYDKRLIGESASASLSEPDIRFDTYVESLVSGLLGTSQN